MAMRAAKGVHSRLTIKVPTTSKPAGIYIPSMYAFEDKGSDILKVSCCPLELSWIAYPREAGLLQLLN